MQSILTFHADGTCTTLKTETIPLAELGECSIRRVSHILPAALGKRLAFIALRLAFGERGRIAEWARQWQGPWQVRFAASPGAVAFTHQSRRVCIAWEIGQLEGRV